MNLERGSWVVQFSGRGGAGVGRVGRVLEVLAPAEDWKRKLRPPRAKVQWKEVPAVKQDASWIAVRYLREATVAEIEAAGNWSFQPRPIGTYSKSYRYVLRKRAERAKSTPTEESEK